MSRLTCLSPPPPKEPKLESNVLNHLKQTVELPPDGHYPIPNCPKSDIDSVPHEIFTRAAYRNIPSLSGREGERVGVGGGGAAEKPDILAFIVLIWDYTAPLG